jgi:DNA (cytosine-5)-methyltransferase 1
MKILNLYAGIGGNRLLWPKEHEVTAIELDEHIAAVYESLYPRDEVIIADAHKFLLEHHTDYDFIWSSPPCQTHSQIRYNIGFKADRKYKKVDPVYADMALYQEILLLKFYYQGVWVVENTIPYYEPLVAGITTGGHIWWSNFHISPISHGNRNHRGGTVESLQERKKIKLDSYMLKNKRQVLRNCVEPEVGLHVFNCATRAKPDNKQMPLFEQNTELSPKKQN